MEQQISGYNTLKLGQINEHSIRIDALHLNETGRRHTLLLHDLSLSVPAGAFVALVGGSGVGKTTLLGALSGIQPAQSGTVLYNGKDFYQNIGSFSNQIGYVPQDDIVHRDLTVGKALYYTAKLRLPKTFKRKQVRQRINEVLEEVEMSHRRKSLVRRLSGGERKRVSLALELLANPRIFLLDEPTAGLDPGLDLKMMQLLRKLADRGHTIVLVTHATNNIDVCDLVCFMARGGRLAFYGPPEEAKTFFHTSNFAEIYNALEPTPAENDAPARAEERYRQSPYYTRYILEPLNQVLTEHEKQDGASAEKETPAPIQRGPSSNPLKQFWYLTLRYLNLLINDGSNLMILLLQAPIIGLILYYLASPSAFTPTSVATCPQHISPLITSGKIVSLDCQRLVNALNSPQGALIVRQFHASKLQILEQAIVPGSGTDAQTILFIMAFAAVLFGCINGVRAFVRETAIYKRERMVNLRIAPYIFSKIVVLGFLSLLQSAILVYIVNLKAHYYQGIFLPVFAEIYITVALTTLAGLMLGLAISALAPNTDRAMAFVPIILIPQVIFSGIIFKLNSPILQAIGALFAARWSMAGLGSSIGLHADKLGVDSFSYKGTLFVSLHRASAVPGAIEHLVIIWGALVLMCIVLCIAIAFFLKRKDVLKK
jgi:ABC-type multidrug transport system ATPase subunit